MLVHLVADYGHGDLAFAEVAQRLALHLPEATIVGTPVPAFDTLAAGFVVGQLALTDGPSGRVVYHNVAPREDTDAPRPDNRGEALLAARLRDGTLVVGPDAGYAFAFLRAELAHLHQVAVGESGSQFRSRDYFPALVAALATGSTNPLAAPVDPAELPSLPERCVVYTDGYGNLKTSWETSPAASGTRVTLRIGDAEESAVVSDGTFEVAAGELSFAPGSSGWPLRAGGRRVFYEVFLRGGSAAARFGQPGSGTPVQVRT